MYKTLKPKRPSPTTVKPITAPPEKAILKALFSDFLAASVVLELDFVETYMPTKPAVAEQAAPQTKHIAVCKSIS